MTCHLGAHHERRSNHSSGVTSHSGQEDHQPSTFKATISRDSGACCSQLNMAIVVASVASAVSAGVDAAPTARAAGQAAIGPNAWCSEMHRRSLAFCRMLFQ